MRDKISKLKSAIKKYGLFGTAKKIFRRISSKICPKINFIKLMQTKRQKKHYVGEIEKNIKNVDRIVIWRSSFGWNVPLYQRPQHIAKCLSEKNTLVLYEVTTQTDDVSTLKRQTENLYLVNFNNPLIKKWIMEVLRKTNKNKYIQIYSTNWSMSVSELKEYIKSGYKIIYEYIDDLNPQLAGTKELPINIKEKYEYMLKDTENVFVVVTADEIQKDVISKRGSEKLVFACNGVDYDHFDKLDTNIKLDDEFLSVVAQNKPIIGYYGALASWFDYEMVKYLARIKPEYNIVLLGIKYDDSYDKTNLKEYENIYFLGAKEYSVLPNYANHFNVCTIPFLINDITKSTSPLKLFEYMALGKPIITTDMIECRKYKSVMIAKDKEEFVKLVDEAIKLEKENDANYFELLRKEALENTWEAKTSMIIDLLKNYED